MAITDKKYLKYGGAAILGAAGLGLGMTIPFISGLPVFWLGVAAGYLLFKY